MWLTNIKDRYLMRQKAKQYKTFHFKIPSIIISIFLFIFNLQIAAIIKPLQDDVLTTSVLLIFLIAINIGLFRSLKLHKAFQRTRRIRYWKFKQKALFCLYFISTFLTISEIVPYIEILIIFFVIVLTSIRFRLFNISLSSLIFKRHFKKLQIDIEEIDKMDGKEFEIYLAKLFNGMGYYTEVTPHTDYGIDVIVIKNKISAGIQAKCYGEGRTVGVEAVNEVCGGAGYWNVQKKIIITNRYFTKKAYISAKHNKVEMINRDGLKILIREFQRKQGNKRTFSSLIILNKFKQN